MGTHVKRTPSPRLLFMALYPTSSTGFQGGIVHEAGFAGFAGKRFRAELIAAGEAVPSTTHRPM